MLKQQRNGGRRHSKTGGALLVALWLGIGLAGCSSLLDVDNPNNVVGDDLLAPAAAKAVANGALYTIMAGYTYVLMDHATVSDELHWIGSRDAFLKLEQGWIDDPLNEFSDQGFREFAPARWMCDEAIRILEMHRDSATLDNINDLARTYMYAAFMYTITPDLFDDFALSQRKLAAPPIGEANMNSMYLTATTYATNGLALVSGDADLQRNLLAMRARTRYGLGVWNLVGTRPISTGLLSAGDASAAAADAAAALAIDNTDWTYQLDWESGHAFGDAQYAINNRHELRWGDDYIIADASDNYRDFTQPDRGIVLQDPIDAMGDPRLDEFMTAFEDGGQLSDMTLLSARAMYLILAEDALVRGVMADFETNINAVRAFSPTALTPFTDGAAGMPTAQEMLIHERRVNLFLQGYRLNDMYRFGIQSSMWQAASPAFSAPGTFLPITKAEIDANCYLNPDFECTEDDVISGGG